MPDERSMRGIKSERNEKKIINRIDPTSIFYARGSRGVRAIFIYMLVRENEAQRDCKENVIVVDV